MSLQTHHANSRGRTTTNWLESYHSFSFNEWYDPTRMGFGNLRVLNDDIIAPGAGFPPHSHRDMEIVTILLSGTLEHRDSTGGHGIIKAGEVQHMSAGTGVTHSEYNASNTEPVHLLQLWIVPNKKGITPSYSQKKFHLTKNKLVPVAGDEGLHMHADATIYLVELEDSIAFNGKNYVFVIDGEIEVNKEKLHKGDAVGIDEEIEITGSGKILVIKS